MSQRPAWEIVWGPHYSGKGSSWVPTLHRTPRGAGETFLLLGERRQPRPSPSRHTGPRLRLSLGASVLRRPSERASGLPWATQQGRGRGWWRGGSHCLPSIRALLRLVITWQAAPTLHPTLSLWFNREPGVPTQLQGARLLLSKGWGDIFPGSTHSPHLLT